VAAAYPYGKSLVPMDNAEKDVIQARLPRLLL
jgi:hypothetical protein